MSKRIKIPDQWVAQKKKRRTGGQTIRITFGIHWWGFLKLSQKFRPMVSTKENQTDRRTESDFESTGGFIFKYLKNSGLWVVQKKIRRTEELTSAQKAILKRLVGFSRNRSKIAAYGLWRRK